MSFKIEPENTFRDDLKENQEAALFMLKSTIFVLEDTSAKKEKYLDMFRKYFHFEENDTAEKMLTVVKFMQSIFKPILSEMVKINDSKLELD